MRYFIFLLLTLFTNISQSQTIYVSPNGSDGGLGTNSSPYKTVAFALGKAVSGNTVYIKAGTYEEYSLMNWKTGVNIDGDGRDVVIIISKTGDEAMRAEFGNGNQFMRNITITGDNLNTLKGINLYNRSNVHIYDCEFRDFKYHAIDFNGAYQTPGQPLVFATGNKFYGNRVINSSQRANSDGSFAGGGMIILASQDGFEMYDNYLNQTQRDSINGNIIGGVGGHIKGLKYYNNISYKKNNNTWRGNHNGNFANWHLEFWYGEGGNQIFNNKFYGGGMAIDIANTYNKKGDYPYAWLIKGNEFSMDAQSHNTDGWVSMGVNLESSGELTIVDSNYFKNLETGMHIIGAGAEVGANRDSMYVTRNIFENIGGGRRVTQGYDIMIGVDENDTITNVFIYNNTFARTVGPYNIEHGIQINAQNQGSMRGMVKNVFIRNNIIMNTDVAYLTFWEWGGIMDSIFSENNIVFNNAYNNNYYRRSNNELGYVVENNLKIDPILNSDLSLSEFSPARGAGINLGYGTDIGAIPYANSSSNLAIVIPGGNRTTTNAAIQLSSIVTGGSGHYSFLWEKVSGGNAEIDNEFSQTINVSGLQNGTYVFRCTVTDSNNQTATGTVTVTYTPSGSEILLKGNVLFSNL